MTEQRIERVDSLPLILYWLTKMRIQEVINTFWQPHPYWQGLSYGQLAVLFLAYVLYLHTHRLSGMEAWVGSHRATLEQLTGWTIRPKEATNDRVGRLMEVLGREEEAAVRFQRQVGQNLIQAYELPTETARYDTTSFSVYHAAPEAGQEQGLLRFGHSKDHRADLVQFKQGLGSLDPAGVPLLTNTVAGRARPMTPCIFRPGERWFKTIGHTHFLYVADCKAAALATRAAIDQKRLLPVPHAADGRHPRPAASMGALATCCKCRDLLAGCHGQTRQPGVGGVWLQPGAFHAMQLGGRYGSFLDGTLVDYAKSGPCSARANRLAGKAGQNQRRIEPPESRTRRRPSPIIRPGPHGLSNTVSWKTC